MVKSVTDRLTRSDWIAHGLRTLAGEGPGALRVGPMAERLKVSRGSFYWHFADVAAFRTALLEQWRLDATRAVIDELETRIPEADRLASLMRRAFAAGRALDRALRSWAAGDAEVAGVVDAVDAERIGYIAGLLEAGGIDAARAASRARLIYWAWLGQAMMTDPALSTIGPDALEDVIARLGAP